MVLSKKLFIALAEILGRQNLNEDVVVEFVLLCRTENPRFNEERFRNHISKTREAANHV